MDRRRTARARILLVAAAAVGIAATLVITLRPPTLRARLAGMRPGLDLLRDSAEACRDRLDQDQSSFQALGRRLDTLRSRVASLEALHPDGVPADSYRVYLETVDSFNAVVAAWEPAAASAGDGRAACEDLVRRHNERADSARVLTEQLDAKEGARAVPTRD